MTHYSRANCKESVCYIQMKSVVDDDNDAFSVELLLPISASLVRRNIVPIHIL